jgi:hypothetical protein
MDTKNYGLKPLPYDRRDFDLHKTFGATAAPAFPDSYSVENGLWCPNQNIGGEVFNLPPMPYGCTDYTQADVCADEYKELKNPLLLENITHANARGGIDMRESLSACLYPTPLQQLRLGWITAYFRITATAPLDFFDAIRLAMLSTKDERRSVSVGTPWYPVWNDPLRGGILPIPASFNTSGLGWHNWKVAGWKTIGGAPYLICKVWAGPDYGDHGFVYMSRELCDAVLNISGAAAFTLTKVKPTDVRTIDFDFVKWCVGFIHSLFKVEQPPAQPTRPVEAPVVPPAPPTPPPTVPPAPATDEKLIAALIQVESSGNDNAIGDKTLAHRAYGCLQVRQPVCDDVNRIYNTERLAQNMLGNRVLSIDTFRKYVKIYKCTTDEEKARVWNGGPSAKNKGTKQYVATNGYWSKVNKILSA